jgi:ankyrin repeat protein
VFCQLEVLRYCLPASIRRTLDHLPESLDDTYLQVLRQIPQANQAHAHRMLQCLLVAVRPLRIEELAEVLAFEFDEAQGGIPKYRAAWQLDDQTQAVLSTCSSLVTIVSERFSDRQVVQFSHFSVKEFLMSNRLGDFSQYHIHPLSAHTTLTQACLGLLLHLGDKCGTKGVEGLPLAKYAAEHWVEHAQIRGVASRVKNGMETLFDPDKPHFAAWLGIYPLESPNGYSNQISNPLYYAVLCGFYDLIKHLTIKHPQYVNAICGRYRFPLFAALEEDHFEIAELLLEHGANVDALETTGETTLLKVVSRPPRNLVNVVELLLKNGADVNARDAALRSSLHLVAYRGELKVAQMLLEHKPYLNFQDCDGKTPLHILSEPGMNDEGNVLNYARLLLNHGAEVNKRDKGNQTPLFLAMMWGRFDLARILLEHGADANAENSNDKTPLLLEIGTAMCKFAYYLLSLH